jgi:O-antigen/teichoic acid export membrane protein
MLLTWPMYITVAVFAGTLLGLFGSVYTQGETVVVVLCCSMLFATLCGMVDVVLNMGGRTSWNLANVLMGLGVNIGLDWWLIQANAPYGGFVGAAIGWGVAIVLQNALAISQTGFILGLHPFGKASLIAGASSVVCFGVLGMGIRLVLPSAWMALVATLVVGGVAYLTIVWLLRGPLQLDAFLALRRRGSSASVTAA